MCPYGLVIKLEVLFLFYYSLDVLFLSNEESVGDVGQTVAE